MNYESTVVSHNLKVRALLFFLRPFHIFNVILLVKLWNLLSYGPSTFPKYFGNATAVQVTRGLWENEFAPYVWYFVIVVMIDVAVQELLPLIGRD